MLGGGGGVSKATVQIQPPGEEGFTVDLCNKL